MNPAEEHPLNALTEQATEEERKKQIYTQESLRTLEGDIQEAIQERNASTASMVMAEQAKYSSSSSSEKKQRPSNYKKISNYFRQYIPCCTRGRRSLLSLSPKSFGPIGSGCAEACAYSRHRSA